MNIYILFTYLFILNILCEYSSSEKLLDSDLEWVLALLELLGTALVTKIECVVKNNDG